jgi:hypothetical protein
LLSQLEARIGVPATPLDDPTQLSRELISNGLYYHRQLLVMLSLFPSAHAAHPVRIGAVPP